VRNMRGALRRFRPVFDLPRAPCLLFTPQHPHIFRSDEAILREGFVRGFTEATTQLSAEVERAAGAAFARSLEQEEGARAQQLADAVAQLRKEQYRCVAAFPVVHLPPFVGPHLPLTCPSPS